MVARSNCYCVWRKTNGALTLRQCLASLIIFRSRHSGLQPFLLRHSLDLYFHHSESTPHRVKIKIVRKLLTFPQECSEVSLEILLGKMKNTTCPDSSLPISVSLRLDRVWNPFNLKLLYCPTGHLAPFLNQVHRPFIALERPFCRLESGVKATRMVS